MLSLHRVRLHLVELLYIGVAGGVRAPRVRTENFLLNLKKSIFKQILYWAGLRVVKWLI